MTNAPTHEKVAARLSTLTTAQVCMEWLRTDRLFKDRIGTEDDRRAVHQTHVWITDELKRRDRTAFFAWLDSYDHDPTPYFTA